MKIHTKHLALCEKGGKFNKTHNTIYKLQEELIEPTGRREVFFFFFLFVFANFCLVLEGAVAASYAGGGLEEQESVFTAKMKSSSVFLLTLLFHTGY